MNKSFIDRLRKDIDIISDEISDLLHKDNVFENRTKSLIEELSIDNHIKTEIIRNHYSTMLVAVRRQLGIKKGEISLLNLLNKLIQHNTSITKEWYASEWLKDSSLMTPNNAPELKDFVLNIPVSEFEKHFGKDYLDAVVVWRDIKVLKSATKIIKSYVDKRIAHRDRAPVVSVNEKEYLEALELLEKMTTKYILLLKQVGMVGLKPVIQD